MTLVRFFDEPSTLDEVGGKAVNLSRLSRAGFPVPPGFAVTTEAFRTAVHEHGLRDLVNEALAGARREAVRQGVLVEHQHLAEEWRQRGCGGEPAPCSDMMACFPS